MRPLQLSVWCIIDLDMTGNNDKAVRMSGAIFLMTAGPLIMRDRDFFDGCADDKRRVTFGVYLCGIHSDNTI